MILRIMWACLADFGPPLQRIFAIQRTMGKRFPYTGDDACRRQQAFRFLPLSITSQWVAFLDPKIYNLTSDKWEHRRIHAQLPIRGPQKTIQTAPPHPPLQRPGTGNLRGHVGWCGNGSRNESDSRMALLKQAYFRLYFITKCGCMVQNHSVLSSHATVDLYPLCPRGPLGRG